MHIKRHAAQALYEHTGIMYAINDADMHSPLNYSLFCGISGRLAKPFSRSSSLGI